MQYKIKYLLDTSLHPDYRWDGEYFCFEPYKNRKLKYLPIGDILSDSQYGISISMNEEKIGTKIYRMNEISNMICSRSISKYAEIDSKTIQIYKLKDKDVLFNRTNSLKFVGRTGIFKKFSDEEIVFASYLVRINPNQKIITSEYLTTFLNTKYGITDVKRRARISINQSNVNPEELKRVEIPLLSKKLQQNITFAFNKAFKLIQKSELKYTEAQSILLSEVGLAHWKQKQQIAFIKKYSDTKQAERIDAEYFHPKYEKIIKAIKSYKGGWDTLGQLGHFTNGSFISDKYYSDSGKKFYIRIKELSLNTPLEKEKMVYINNNFTASNETFVKENDFVLATIGATTGKVNLITKEFIGSYPSNNTSKFTLNQIKNPFYFECLLRSPLVQRQIRQRLTQTAQEKISNKDLNKIIIPLLFPKAQSQIQKKVFEAVNFHKKSKYLLECAKCAVEKTIEESEEAAIKWLEDKLSK